MIHYLHMKEIKKVDMRSVVVLFTVIYGVIGSIGGLLLGASIIIPEVIAGEILKGILLGMLGLVAITGMYMVLGAIGAVCLVFIYNTIAKKFGGIKFQLTDVTKEEEEQVIQEN